MVINNDEVKDNNLNSSDFDNQDNDKQTLFKLFGIEMIAPKGLQNPRIIYISFILINFIILIILKRLIMH